MTKHNPPFFFFTKKTAASHENSEGRMKPFSRFLSMDYFNVLLSMKERHYRSKDLGIVFQRLIEYLMALSGGKIVSFSLNTCENSFNKTCILVSLFITAVLLIWL